MEEVTGEKPSKNPPWRIAKSAETLYNIIITFQGGIPMTAQELISRMTLEEKAALLQGKTVWTTWDIPRLGLPSMTMADGPHGLRRAKTDRQLTIRTSIPATCFPTAAAMANSWDPELAEEMGKALGLEAASLGVHVLLGPGLNIKRSPLCGRNFEYYSEDPYLAGKMAAAGIRGIQSRGVSACAKHFAVNSQELKRMSVDSVVDERTLREIYLTGFEIAVKEGSAKAIMSSYNPVNGTYANENALLLQRILRQEWGFDGYVVSDWGACNDPVAAIQNGSDLNMPAPGLGNAAYVVQQVREGALSEKDLDARLVELLPVILATTSLHRDRPTYDQEAHHALAKKCAAGAIVLLENDGILPLAPDTAVAVIGEFARKPRYQGAGSSQVVPTRLDDLLTALGSDVKATYARGYRRGHNKPEDKLIAEAVEIAGNAPVVLLCVGLEEISECESVERPSMDLPESQIALIQAVCKVNPNVVLVLSGGSPFRLPSLPYRAVIHGYLGGQAGASAMADALLGKENPGGALSETWPFGLGDTPCHGNYPSEGPAAEYREGLYVGYRYYTTAKVPVRYPFGHGLSYTTFDYSDLEATNRQVSFTVTNTGSRDGSTVCQIYISCRLGKVFRPEKELKAFRRVYLKAGESQRVTVELDDKAFRYFNVKTNGWETETGHYQIALCSNAETELLKTTVRILGTDAPLPYGALPGYESGKVSQVTDEEFAALLGRSLPKAGWSEQLQENDPLCRLCEAKTGAARLLGKFLRHKVRSSKKADMTWHAAYNLPIRGLPQYTGNRFTRHMVQDFLYWANGHFFGGLSRLIKGYFRGRKEAKAYKELLEYGPRE
jgi:beta-glucosidase